jgi:hypothetical protein
MIYRWYTSKEKVLIISKSIQAKADEPFARVEMRVGERACFERCQK